MLLNPKSVIVPALAVALAIPGAANAEVKYTVTHLKPPCEGNVMPIAMNNKGQVVASVYPTASGRPSRPVMWTAGVPRELVIGEAGELLPVAINDAGTVAMNRLDDGAAFLVQTAPALRSLGRVMATQPETRVAALNRYNHVAGYFADLTVKADEPESIPNYSFSGALRNEKIIGGLPAFSNATSINDTGQVSGWMHVPADERRGFYHAFLYANGRVKDLGSLDGPRGLSMPSKVSNTGVVVGYSSVKDKYAPHAFAYVNGKMHDLGTLVEWGASEAKDVNDAGDVVGAATGADPDAPDPNVAFIRPLASPMQDLNKLVDPSSGWHLADAVAINAKGQILVRGYKRFGKQWRPGAVVLTPR